MAKARTQSGRKPQLANREPRPGRKPQIANRGRRVSLGLKVTPEIKNKLDAAVKESGRTQSQEAEARIEQSFIDQRQARLFSELYFGRELSALLEVIGRAMRDAGTHAAANAAAAKLGSPDWIDNPYGFDAAIKAVARVLEALRPPGPITVPKPNFPAEMMLSEAIANGLLSCIGRDQAPGDFMEEWASQLRPRLGRLRARLSAFDYTVGAHSALLPSGNVPGLLLYDADDRALLDETEEREK